MSDQSTTTQESDQPTDQDHDSDYIHDPATSPSPTPQTQESLVQDLLGHLGQALSTAVQLQHAGHPTADWQRAIQRVIRAVSGGTTMSNVPLTQRTTPLPPVGPVVPLDQWVEDTISLLQKFREEYMAASREDAANFPPERPAADWMQEFAASSR